MNVSQHYSFMNRHANNTEIQYFIIVLKLVCIENNNVCTWIMTREIQTKHKHIMVEYSTLQQNKFNLAKMWDRMNYEI